jgi:hypothetical protein
LTELADRLVAIGRCVAGAHRTIDACRVRPSDYAEMSRILRTVAEAADGFLMTK